MNASDKPERPEVLRMRQWEAASEADCESLRRADVTVKFRQLSALMASRSLFGIDPKRDSELAEVRSRWERIRKAVS